MNFCYSCTMIILYSMTHTYIVVWTICLKHVFHTRLNIYKGKDFIFRLGVRYSSYTHTPPRTSSDAGRWDDGGLFFLCSLHFTQYFVYFLKYRILILENALHVFWVKIRMQKSYNPIFVTKYKCEQKKDR